MNEAYQCLIAGAEYLEKQAAEMRVQAEKLNPENAIFEKAIEARKALPETMPVIKWLEWAKEMGFEWADSAIDQVVEGKNETEASLSGAIHEAFSWYISKEGEDFWLAINAKLEAHGL